MSTLGVGYLLSLVWQTSSAHSLLFAEGRLLFVEDKIAVFPILMRKAELLLAQEKLLLAVALQLKQQRGTCRPTVVAKGIFLHPDDLYLRFGHVCRAGVVLCCCVVGLPFGFFLTDSVSTPIAYPPSAYGSQSVGQAFATVQLALLFSGFRWLRPSSLSNCPYSPHSTDSLNDEKV